MKSLYQPFLFFFIFLVGPLHLSAQYPAGSPVALNGKLKVTVTGSGSSTRSRITSECGNNVQLRGMSSHGLQWTEDCINGSLDALVNDWKIDVLRLAMYVRETGYETNPTKWKGYIDNMVDECGRKGIYCMIDWHVMNPGDPNLDIGLARDFWVYMATKHGSKKHVIYEICNEPNGVDWSTVKRYADDIIPRIRAIDPSTIIIVGSPDWSSQPQQAVSNKLNYTNIAYSLHFYAGESAHSAYRTRGDQAIAGGLALFVTEFGLSPASGNGSINEGEGTNWMNWMNSNGVGWCNWSYSDINESSAALAVNACATASWNSTTPSGAYIKARLVTADAFTNCNTNIEPPSVSITSPANNTSAIGSMSFTASVTPASGTTISKVDFYATSNTNVTTLIGTATSSPYTITWASPPVGTYIVKAIATASNSITGTSSGITVFINTPQTPYGAVWPIPGKIEAENYDVGGNNNSYFDNTVGNSGTATTFRPGEHVDVETTSDAGGGYHVGFTAIGEWLEYSVSVAATGKYDLKIRVASNTTTAKSMHIEMDGVNVSGAITIPNTGGWTTWQTVTAAGINLTAGEQILRIVFDTDGYNLNYIEAISLTPLGTPIVSITSPADGASFNAPASITINATATDNGTITKVDFYSGATLIGTDNTAPYSYTWTPVSAGSYTLTARATDNSNIVGVSSGIAVTVTPPQTPYGGTVWPIPGKVEAENYDIGGSNNAYFDSDEGNTGGVFRTDNVDLEACTDAGTGYNVGYIIAGEWLEYSVNVANAGKYSFQFRVASTASAKSLHVEMNGTNVTGIVAVPNTTGWQTWQTVTITGVNLTAGPQIMRVFFDTDGYNLNYVNVIAENLAPTVSITSPVAGSTYLTPASISFTATAADPGGSVSKVEYYNGTTLLGSATVSPYNFTWSNVQAGAYTITAKATDNTGLTTTSSSIELVVGQNQLPTVSISEPASNTVYTAPASVNLTAVAADSDGSIASVEFFNGTTSLGTDATAPYTFSWSDVAAGTYLVTAKATDNQGGITTSAAITVVVNGTPAVSITSPATGSTYVANASVAFTASASDADGSVSKVEYFNGTTLLGSATVSPYSFTWSDVIPGTYTITAKATDNRGAITTSSSIQVIVNQNQLPTVSISEPASNTVYLAPATAINFAAVAEDLDGNIVSVEFFNGAASLGTDAAAPYTYAWSNVVAGTYTITAKATDDKGGATTSAAITIIVNQAPSISISSPVTSSTYPAPANITFTAAASDADGSVSKVEYFNGATSLGSATVAPFSYTWSDVAVGTYTITAKATDNRGAVTTSSGIQVIVNQNQLPTISITAPASNTIYSAPAAAIDLTAVAGDQDGSIVSVEFFNGSTSLGSDATAPYTYTWSNVPAGTYLISAKATDNLGGFTTSAAITVIVNQAPAISITSPVSSSTFVAPGEITFTAEASDADGSVSKVEYFNGATLLGSATVSPYTYNWSGVAVGTYIITAKATDNRGAVTTSASIQVIVNQNQLPTISITQPASNTVYVAPAAAINFTASAADADGSIVSVEFFNGITSLGSDATVPYTFTWPDVAAGTYSITAKASDNNGGVTTSARIIVIVNQAPTVSITSPENSANFMAPADITIDAVASDLDGTVSVEFYNGNTLLGSDNSEPFSFTMTGSGAGTYSITAKAIDNHGASSTSEAVAITVSINQVPTLFFVSPANNDVFDTDETILIDVQANDADGNISKVDFYNGLILLGSDNSEPYTFSVSGLPAGTYDIQAVATDNHGGTFTETVTVTVQLATGIIGKNATEGLAGNLYPNPSNSSFTLKVNQEVKNIVIRDLYGKQMEAAESSGIQNISLGSDLEEGTYIMQVQYSSGKVEIFKMIKIE